MYVTIPNRSPPMKHHHLRQHLCGVVGCGVSKISLVVRSSDAHTQHWCGAYNSDESCLPESISLRFCVFVRHRVGCVQSLCTYHQLRLSWAHPHQSSIQCSIASAGLRQYLHHLYDQHTIRKEIPATLSGAAWTPTMVQCTLSVGRAQVNAA